jgi:hypothetical protein
VVFPGPIATDGNHDGGRMAFGPDGKLYVTTGDIHQPELPRDLQSLNGKILRMEADGSVPADNPWVARGGNAAYVWSSGHRHPQGLAWDDRGRLWESEHGPSGENYPGWAGSAGRCCRDEVNLIVKGGDYGWPSASGDDRLEGTIPPVVHAGSQSPWAPGGLAFAGDGKLYMPLLAGQRLLQLTPDAGSGIAAQAAFFPGARLRAARYDPCRGALWFTTDGASAAVRRVAVGLEGRAAPPCGSAVPGGSLPTPTPLPGTPTTPAAPLVVAPSAAERLLGRGTAALRAKGARAAGARGTPRPAWRRLRCGPAHGPARRADARPGPAPGGDDAFRPEPQQRGGRRAPGPGGRAAPCAGPRAAP